MPNNQSLTAGGASRRRVTRQRAAKRRVALTRLDDCALPLAALHTACWPAALQALEHAHVVVERDRLADLLQAAAALHPVLGRGELQVVG